MTTMITLIPLVQLVILANAITFEVKNIQLYIVDQDQSQVSQQLISHFQHSDYFTLSGWSSQIGQGKKAIQDDKANLAMVIPHYFQRDLMTQKHASLQLLINAVDGSAASVSQTYTSAIINNFASRLTHSSGTVNISTATLKLDNHNWYNPQLKYSIYMVPGLLVLLVTMVELFMSGMNITREKELGTIEQLNITPIKRYQFISGKLLPFWIIGMAEMAVGLFVGWLIYALPFVGHLWLIFAGSAIYLLVMLGLGLLISTVTETQQQAMFVGWFLMVVFLLMSGLFTPIESMPLWAQHITIGNPVAQFIEIMRNVLMKGSNLSDLRFQFADLAVMAVIANALAVIRYRKTHA